MLYLGFALRNPFNQRFDVVKEWHLPVTKNKSIDMGFYRNANIVEGSFGITGFKQDHAGFSFDFGILTWNFDFVFYDNRHYYQRR